MALLPGLDATVSQNFFRLRSGTAYDVMAEASTWRLRASVLLFVGPSLVLGCAPHSSRPGFTPGSEMRRALGAAFDQETCGSGRFVGGLFPAVPAQRCAKRQLLPRQKEALQRVENDELGTTPGDRAMAEFLAGDVEGSIALFEEALEKDRSNPDLWSDLAAARLARFEGTQEAARDFYNLVLALHAADEAVRLRPHHPEGHFNLAVSLKALSLDGVTKGPIQRDDSAVRVLQEEVRSGGEVDSVLLKAAAPRLRREAEGPLLLGCVQLEMQGKRRQAESCFKVLQGIAEEVERRTQDRLAVEAAKHAQAILYSRAPSYVARKALLDGLVILQQGKDAAAEYDQVRAEPCFEKAARRLASVASPLVAVAELERLAAVLNRDVSQASRELSRLQRTVDRSTYVGLAARQHWLEGLAMGKGGLFQSSLDHYDESLKLYESLGEPDNVAAVRSHRAEVLRYKGFSEDGWRERALALRIARRAGDWKTFHNSLFDAAEACKSKGWNSLALRFERIGLDETATRSDALGAAEILTRRARFLVDLGRAPEAEQDLALARQWLAKVRDIGLKARSQVDVEVVEADINPGQTLLNSDRTLDEALRQVPALRAEILFTKAHASRALNYLKGSRQLYEDAAEATLHQASSFESWPNRRQFLLQNRVRLDELVEALHDLHDPQPLRALDHVLDWLRVEASGNRSRPTTPAPSVRRRGRSPAPTAHLVLRYMDQRVFGWLVGPAGTTPFQNPLPQTDLTSAMQRLRRGAEQDQGFGKNELRDLEWLSVRILGPIQRNLAGLKELKVVADPQLREVPFAALRNPATHHYLVEEMEVSVVVSVHERMSRPLGDRKTAGQRFLGVGDPSSRVARREGLFNLPGARREVGEIGELYRSKSMLLRGSEATKERVLAALPLSQVVHFSAHAKEETSRGLILFLSPSPEIAGDDGVLDGTEIEALDLRQLQLVVLAACRSAAESPSGQSLGSLVEPFLAAGTERVVGSLWLVKDSEPLSFWTTFYRALRSKKTPEAALRKAQLACLKDKKHPSLANPAYWAGFAVFHGDLPMKGE
jgi:CHAT domain-containing protein/tetratricopeptide (TPR) repeat protein